MFYRVAYLIIFVLIMLALMMVKLQVDLVVRHENTGALRQEVMRLVAWTDMPPPRSIVEKQGEMIITFSPYESFRKTRNLLHALKKIRLTGRTGQDLLFTVRLNDNQLALFKQLVRNMGGNEMDFHLVSDSLELALIEQDKLGVDCVAFLSVKPALPNFRMLTSELTGKDADVQELEAKTIIKAKSGLLQPIADAMVVASSSKVYVLIHHYEPTEPKPTLVQCQEATLAMSDEFYAYLFFPMLSSHLRDYRLHYNLDNATLRNF